MSAAGRRAGEILWRLPLHPEYADLIKGHYGDIAQRGREPRAPASVTAAEFLKRFVGDVPWVHLDIAGVAWDTNKAYAPKGGVGLRRAAARRPGVHAPEVSSVGTQWPHGLRPL